MNEEKTGISVRLLWPSYRQGRTPEFVYHFKTTPREHQVRALEQAWLKPAWGHWHEMRTGKGVKTVYEMDAMAQAGGATRFLIVAPKRTLSTWSEMIHTHAHTDFLVCKHWPNLTQVMAAKEEGRPTIVLTNYEKLAKRGEGKLVMNAPLLNWFPEYVCVDEAHLIKGRSANRSKALHLFGGIVKYRRALGGTPDPNGWANYFSIYKYLDHTIFGNSWGAFADRYLLLDWWRNIKGYKNVGELAEKIHSISDRVVRADCMDIPATEDVLSLVDLPPFAARVYKNVAELAYAELNEEGKIVSTPLMLTCLLRLAQITGGFVTRNDGGIEWLHDAKISAMMGHIEETLADAGAKVVVFARFRRELDRICEALNQAGIKHVLLHGGTGNDAPIRAAFANDPHTRVMVTQIATGSLGLDLSAAETMIIFSWDFDAATYLQSHERIWQEHPKSKLVHIYLKVPHSIDGTMLAVVQGKIKHSSLLLDNWHQLAYGGFDAGGRGKA